jgi:hypothetical protein
MRREADAPLRRLEADLAPHHARQPGIGARIARPDAFVEPAEDEEIDRLQARLERPPDVDARLGADRPRDRDVAEKDAKQRRRFLRREDELALVFDQAFEKLCQRLALRPAPEKRVAPRLVGRRRTEYGKERRREILQRHRDRAAAKQRFGRCEALDQCGDECVRLAPVGTAETSSRARNVAPGRVGCAAPRGSERGGKGGKAAMHAVAAQQRQLENARGATAAGTIHTEGGERVAEEREQRDGIAIDHGLDELHGKDALR